MFSAGNDAAFIRQKAAEFTVLSGLDVGVTFIDKQLVGDSLQLEKWKSRSDGYIADCEGMAALVSSDAVKSISSEVETDSGLAWRDIHPTWSSSFNWSGASGLQQHAVPITGQMLLMFYQQNIMQQHSLQVPSTWDELLQVARKAAALNATDHAICMDVGVVGKMQAYAWQHGHSMCGVLERSYGIV